MRYVIQLVRWLLRFMDKSSEDRVDAYSAQSAFFIIMGFIPFVMLLLILLQYTPMTKEDVMTLLKVIFPEGFHAYLETLVGSVYTKSTALLSGTVITAVWACSKAMMSVSKGLNKIYDTKIRKNYFLARFRAALYIILLLISLILAMGLFVFGNLLHDYLLHYLPWLRAVSWLIISARTIGTILLLCMIFCAMYAWLPYKRQDFFSQLPGAVATSFAWSVFSYGFSVYSRKVFGWIPSDLIAEVGQNRSFLLSGDYTDSIPGLTQMHDTIQIQEASLQSRILFDYAGNARQSGLSESGHTDINIPVLVWNSRWNNLINIKGGNIHSSDIRRMEKENNLVNIHFLYFEHEQQRANMLCNTLQNMKMKLSPDVQYRFTATCISNTGNRYSQVLSDFSKWIDFITTDSIQFSSPRGNTGLNSALSNIMNTISGNVFDKNLFIILGSNQNLKINESLIARAGQKSASFLFVQTNRSYDTPYQDFVLQAKSTLDELSRQYVNHIANYIVDDKLVKPELFRNMETDEANIFLFDVPSKSLSAGGIIFPKGRGILHNTALELALDSINMNIQMTNETLLESLQYHESKLGTLRSRPTNDLKEIIRKVYKNDTIRMERISRNSVSDTYFTKLSIPDSTLCKYEEGYIFSEKELENLLQNYRGLLPEFADSIQKKEFRVLRRIYRKQRSGINRSFHRKLLKRNAVISDLFYYRTGIPAEEELLYNLKIRKLKQRKCKKNGFHSIYPAVIDKLKILEGMYAEQSFETVSMSGETYYFIPKHLLP